MESDEAVPRMHRSAYHELWIIQFTESVYANHVKKVLLATSLLQFDEICICKIVKMHFFVELYGKFVARRIWFVTHLLVHYIGTGRTLLLFIETWTIIAICHTKRHMIVMQAGKNYWAKSAILNVRKNCCELCRGCFARNQLIAVYLMTVNVTVCLSCNFSACNYNIKRVHR